MNEFDLLASGWDLNPVHLERSQAIADLLKKMVPLKNDWSALEFGAGTGLLSILLKDHLKEILLIDSSSEMVKVMQDKFLKAGIANLKPVMLDLEVESIIAQYDLIFNQMVFHHVENLDTILQKFNAILKPGGYLAIADLFPEDGSFHGSGFTGHQGFDPEKLAKQMDSILNNQENTALYKQNLVKAAEELCWEKEEDGLMKILRNDE